MKKFFKWFIIISVFLFAQLSCTVEPEELREYPDVTTLGVTEIDETGVTFRAEIDLRKNKNIEKYGFVWGPTPHLPRVGTGKFEKIMDGSPENNKFSFRLSNGLKAGVEIIVRAFVIQDSLIIYGDEKSFTSLGSMPPVIKSFSPTLGTWGDTITIAGKNFSENPVITRVLLGQFSTPIFYANDSVLKFQIPIVPNEPIVPLRLTIYNDTIAATEDFHYVIPQITGLDRDTIRKINDTIQLFGTDFHPNPYYSKIFVDNIQADIITVTDSVIAFVIPEGIISDDQISEFREIEIRLVTVGNSFSLPCYLHWHSTFTRKNDFPGIFRQNATAFAMNGKGYIGMGRFYDSQSSIWLKDF